MTGSTWMRTASSLRPERARCSSPSARDSRPPWARGTRTTTRSSSSDRHRPEHLGPLRQVQEGDRVVDGSRLAGDRGQPRGGRQVGLLPLPDLAPREPGLVPAHQRLHARARPGRPRPACVPPGRTSADGVAPPAQRLLAGPQVRPGQQQPGVEQHHGGVPARRHRLGAGRRHHDRRVAVDVGQDPVARGGPDPGLREGAAQLLGGARVAEHRGAQPVPAALGARPRVGRGAAPAAGRRRRRAGQGERTRARRAPRGRAAAVAGQGQDVAGARGLHQHRTLLAGPPGRVSWASCGIRAACGSRVDAVVAGPGDPHGQPAAEQVARRGDLVGPAGAEQVLALHAAREAARPGPPRPPARRAAAASRGCAGRAPAARRTGRRRRPRWPPARGRAPARRRRCGCRRRSAGRHGRRRGTRGSASRGRPRWSAPRGGRARGRSSAPRRPGPRP